MLLAAYCLLIVIASLVGGWLPSVVQLTHIRTQVIVSFVAGLMLGIALLHLLPHAVAELGRSQLRPMDTAVGWTLGGLLAMFFLIRAFHFHHHGEFERPAAEAHDHAPGETCHHPPSEADVPHPATRNPHQSSLSWTGVLIGLGVHTLIDGMALAASVRSEQSHVSPFGLPGAATFLAIVLHKPLDAVSITALMAARGWTAGWRNAVNAGFAMMCPLGALLLVAGASALGPNGSQVVGCALAFSAGVFLCISLGDLLPEVEFHSHDRLKLSAALLLGIALAWGMGLLEPAHAHLAVPRGAVPTAP